MPNIRAVQFEDWPEPHRLAYDLASEPPDSPSSGYGLAAEWSEPMHGSVRLAWGLLLEFCNRHSLPVDREPCAIVVPEYFMEFIRELVVRVRYSTAATYVRHIGEALRVMSPTVRLQFVRDAAADLGRAASPMPDEETPLVAASTVYAASLQHMDGFWGAAEHDIADGIRYLDGLRLAVGILTSVRLRTLAVTGARHLRKSGECYEIEYQPHEVKTKKPFDLMLPPELTRYIERGFLVSDRWRDHTPAEDKPLWITRNGQRMSHAQIYARTCATTLELLQVELGPQQLRRVGPSSLRKFAPRQAHLATSMLQHGTPRITVKSYLKTGTSAAAAELHQLRLKRYGAPQV